MKHLRALVFGLVAGVAVMAGLESEAQAGCNPACTNGQICRYEAAGGHFYCASPGPRGGRSRMQSRGQNRSAANAPTAPNLAPDGTDVAPRGTGPAQRRVR